jgi:transcriptional regulator of acetoin/glycerol metabolism
MRLSEQEFAFARDKNREMIRAAGPGLDQLFLAVGGVGCCVVLADDAGVSLERRGAAVDDRDFVDWGLWTGTVWSEGQEGTNAIGTCLAERRAVTINRDQHFLARNSALTCISTPLFDAHGQLAGALDVSSCRSDLTEGFATLIAHSVHEIARRIETEVFRLEFPNARIMLLAGRGRASDGLLVVDKDDLVIGASYSARLAFKLNGDLSLAPIPVEDLLGGMGDDGFDKAERAVITRALARSKGNVSAAARGLGISRATLNRKLHRSITH